MHGGPQLIRKKATIHKKSSQNKLNLIKIIILSVFEMCVCWTKMHRAGHLFDTPVLNASRAILIVVVVVAVAVNVFLLF